MKVKIQDNIIVGLSKGQGWIWFKGEVEYSQREWTEQEAEYFQLWKVAWMKVGLGAYLYVVLRVVTHIAHLF